MLRYSESKIKKLRKFNLSLFPGYSTKFNIKNNTINLYRFNRSLTSYYLIELIEKQKLKVVYKLKESTIKQYLISSIKYTKFNLNILINLRLDSILYNLGFCITILQARQLITHGHILINLGLVKSPSYSVKKGEIISINLSSLNIVLLCKYNLFIRYNTSFNTYNNINFLICLTNLKCTLLNIIYVKENYIKYKDYLIFNYYK